MALVHEFENSGNWLIKRRSWLPIFLVAAGIVMMYLGNRQAIIFDLRDEMIFLGVSIFGEIIRIFTIGFVPGSTSGINISGGKVADELNTTGIYSIVRHPLYIGNFFMWLGPVLFLRSIWFTVFFGFIYWLYAERIMFAKEQFLRRKYGEAYDKWSGKVSSFIPFTFNFIPSILKFSFRNVLRREYNCFINIFVIFLLLDVFRNLFLSERIFFTMIWLWLFTGAFVIWLIIRSIHKYTRLLRVERR